MAGQTPREYRCYHVVDGRVCGRKLLDGVLTGPDWVSVHCSKCKRLAIFPRPVA